MPNKLRSGLNVELRRHNGQNPYGAWLLEGEEDETHGDIPETIYGEAINEALETGAEKGHITGSNGQHYDWRRSQ